MCIQVLPWNFSWTLFVGPEPLPNRSRTMPGFHAGVSTTDSVTARGILYFLPVNQNQITGVRKMHLATLRYFQAPFSLR